MTKEKKMGLGFEENIGRFQPPAESPLSNLERLRAVY